MGSLDLFATFCIKAKSREQQTNNQTNMKNPIPPDLRALLLIALILTLPAMAQPLQITGTVSDAVGPIPSVTVQTKTATTITNTEGHFTITANPQDTLVITAVGYISQQVPIDNRTTIIITLLPDTKSLQEVTVNAGYYTVKEKERTGSIARITAREIDQQPVTNVLAAMQGRMAGVSITQANGTPGSAFEIRIRGQNSLRFGANNPLYVIDGVPYSSDPIGNGVASPVLGGSPNPLNGINPEQVESIEVLKDADATAIYGSRGANGVVLITTKKGRAGKTRFTGKVASGLARVTNFMDLMGSAQYVAMRQEAYANGNLPIPATAYDVNGTWDQSRTTDWQKKLAGGTAQVTNVDAALSGGSAATQYLASATFAKQEGVYLKDANYKKGAFRLQLGHTSENGKFRGNFTAGYTVQRNRQPRMDVLREGARTAPNAPALYDGQGNLNWENNTFMNPMRVMEDDYDMQTRDLVAGGMLSYALSPGLELRSNVGYSELANFEYATVPSTRFMPSQNLGPEASSAIHGRADRKSWIIEPQLNWKRDIGKSRLDALAGATFQKQVGTQLVQDASNFPSNSLIYNLASASVITTSVSERTDYRYQAFFGRLNYNYDSRYIVNLTGRRDGSSRFGPGRRYANFGAVGAAWLFSNEGFLRESKWLGFGKLRLSYGTTGSDQIGNYQYLDTYGSAGASYDGVVGLVPTRLFNPRFAWEKNRKFEAALEAGFLGDRIFLTAAFYNNVSDNQLTGVPLPGTTGFPSLQANFNATVQNRGLEFTLRTENVRGASFNWTTSINLSLSRNKLLEFPDLESSTYASQYIIGRSLGIRKAYHLLGVDPGTGLYTFEDVNGDGAITAEHDKETALDLAPEYFGGVSNQVRYKGFTLDFLFQFVKQRNLDPELMYGMPGTASNQPLSVSGHWQQPGDVATHQKYALASNSAAFLAFNNYVESDGAVVDASYIRLKNVSLSYDLPERLLKVARCRLFIEGQNLLTFTSYKGNDPEFTAIGFLPPLKVVSAGMQFTF